MGFIIVVFSIVAVFSVIVGVVKAVNTEQLSKTYLPFALAFVLGLTAHLAYNQDTELELYQARYAQATDKVDSLRNDVDHYRKIADESINAAKQAVVQYQNYKAVAEDTIRAADKRNADLEANLRATHSALKEASEKLVKIQKVVATKGN